MCQKLKKPRFFNVFGYKRLSREPQGAQEGTQNTPKENQDPRGKDPILDPKISFFWKQIGPQFQTKRHTKKNQKKNTFWDPLPPHLRGPNNAPPKNKRKV